jgi:AraC-like DNA-binding protein
MNVFQQKIQRLKNECHSNNEQIRIVIGTRNFIKKYFDQELNLDLLSKVQCTSKFHLLRLFKQYYGITIRQFLIDIRLDKSKEFLRSGMSVTETCFAVGYESPSSFSTLFKRKTGVTPTRFQKKQLSKS